LPGEIGHEPTVDDWVAVLVQDVFRQVKRLLDDRGILFVIVGDRMARGKSEAKPPDDWHKDKMPAHADDDLPPGNLMDLPGRLARGMQRDGWVWRREIIWAKPDLTSHEKNAPQITHERVLMFTKSMKYDFNQKAVQEQTDYGSVRPGVKGRHQGGIRRQKASKDLGTVWRIPHHTRPHRGVAPSPVELVRRLIRYATEEGDHVIDCFMGTGTTGIVAKMLHRRFTGIELNPEFAKYAFERVEATADHPPASWNTLIVPSETDLLKKRLALVTHQHDALHEMARIMAEWVQPLLDYERSVSRNPADPSALPGSPM
jgi:DNA modification methylase